MNASYSNHQKHSSKVRKSLRRGLALGILTALSLMASPALALDGALTLQQIHSQEIMLTGWSKDSRFVFSGDTYGTIKLWDAASGRLIRSFGHLSESISALEMSPDNRRLLAGTIDEVAIFDSESGRKLLQIEGCSRKARFSADGKQVIGLDENQQLKIWDSATGQEIQVMPDFPEDEELFSIGISQNGRYALSWHKANRFRLWDLQSNRLIKSFLSSDPALENYVTDFQLSNDGKQLMLAETGGSFSLWDPASGKLLKRFAPEKHPTGLHLMADGKQALICDQHLERWNLETGKLIKRYPEAECTSVVASPDGTQLIKHHEYDFEILDAEMGQSRPMYELADEFMGRTVSPDGQHLIGAHYDAEYFINLIDWNLATGRRQILGQLDQIPKEISFSADGKDWLLMSQTELVAWDSTSNKLRWQLTPPETAFKALSPLPDGKQLLVGQFQIVKDEDGEEKYRSSLLFLDAGSGKMLKSVPVDDLPDKLRFMPGGQYALTSFRNGFGLMKLETGALIQTAMPEFTVEDLEPTPDGKQVVIGTDYNSLELWHTRGNKLQHSYLQSQNESDFSHDGGILSVALSPDGKQVLSGSMDTTARLWDLTGPLKQIFRDHEGWVTDAGFLKGRPWVYTLSEDGSTKLWNPANGELVATFVGFSDGEWICLTRQGYYTASGPGIASHLNLSRGLKVWDASPYLKTFDRPDLVAKILAGASVDPAPFPSNLK